MNIVVMTGALVNKSIKETRYGLMFWGAICQLKAVKDGKGGLEYIKVYFNIRAYNVQAEALQTTIAIGDMITVYGELESMVKKDDKGRDIIHSFTLVHNINKVVTMDKMTIIDNMAQADLNFVTAKTTFGKKFKRTYAQNTFMRKQDKEYGKEQGERGKI